MPDLGFRRQRQVDGDRGPIGAEACPGGRNSLEQPAIAEERVEAGERGNGALGSPVIQKGLPRSRDERRVAAGHRAWITVDRGDVVVAARASDGRQQVGPKKQPTAFRINEQQGVAGLAEPGEAMVFPRVVHVVAHAPQQSPPVGALRRQQIDMGEVQGTPRPVELHNTGKTESSA